MIFKRRLLRSPDAQRIKILCIRIVIVLLVLKMLYSLFAGNVSFWRSEIIVQSDLLDYNEDGLRPGWPFQITKNYHMYDLRKYSPKQKIISNSRPGDEGKPIIIPILEDLSDAYSEYEINIVASNRVTPNRSLPDYRDPKCIDITYPSVLPTASVVIAFHNEALSILKRAILSVINRSPDELLEEVILVDDFSDKADLKESFEKYLSGLPKVKLIKMDKREGVIRARLIGAENARGQVLIFMDANTEANDGWMEPLLSRIASDRSVVALPHIDQINPTSMAYNTYHTSPIYGIGWNLHVEVLPKPKRETIRNRGDENAPYRTPVLIGCAFAIDREFFFEIGTFDAEMNIYGGESTELSLRVWMCGGAVEILPCSRIGHYFRSLPFSFNAEKEEILLYNNLRTAEVWMDEYLAFFDSLISPLLRKIKAGDVSKRLAIRQNLKCKNFHWYMKNVFPESVMVTKPKKIGQIQRLGSKYCLDRLGRGLNNQIGIYMCHGNGYSQAFSYQNNHQIVFHPTLCLSRRQETMNETVASSTILNVTDTLTTSENEFKNETQFLLETKHVVLLQCDANNGNKWLYDQAKNQIVHIATGLCLATELWMVIVTPCNLKDERQHWKILSFNEYKQNLMLNIDKI
ncbi:polypeptide N-acetylgalactosaminyltransferase 13-like [Contarinia nasturtii]|uniref:polypeptide N-acetylgalactosaminyltransferase 13-like n=1 Tax=Contarinia nasturtii TaxID=265458 RepID=UPI0012D3E777|nr:polypeptide N-acetylgalactosaminyltransferase 13-like [Contarinia nasturtii]